VARLYTRAADQFNLKEINEIHGETKGSPSLSAAAPAGAEYVTVRVLPFTPRGVGGVGDGFAAIIWNTEGRDRWYQ